MNTIKSVFVLGKYIEYLVVLNLSNHKSIYNVSSSLKKSIKVLDGLKFRAGCTRSHTVANVCILPFLFLPVSVYELAKLQIF